MGGSTKSVRELRLSVIVVVAQVLGSSAVFLEDELEPFLIGVRDRERQSAISPFLNSLCSGDHPSSPQTSSRRFIRARLSSHVNALPLRLPDFVENLVISERSDELAIQG
jgi:hypothetical protein